MTVVRVWFVPSLNLITRLLQPNLAVEGTCRLIAYNPEPEQVAVVVAVAVEVVRSFPTGHPVAAVKTRVTPWSGCVLEQVRNEPR